ncbi:hypothetical protein KY290_028229 [Solanum tuberosum]|uniref:Gag-pol polyprotein n=1 Tax=Solanum tuberosum TaxID=4113 RepID=A0ABQ7UHB8_SOLTU|nr:hypothetical protein KY290_028229 [Solanum tuberosum]
MRATQTGIQGNLELILDIFKNLKKRPPRGQKGAFTGGDGVLPVPGFDGRAARPPVAELKEELCVRFGDEWMEDVVEEFNKLEQTGSVGEFLVKFEDLKAQMII